MADLKQAQTALSTIDTIQGCTGITFENPLRDIERICVNPEGVAECLNRSLGAYGISTKVDPTRTAVYIDDGSMSQVFDYFKNEGFRPVLTANHLTDVSQIVETADKNRIDLIWKLPDLKQKYFIAKQYGFNGIQLYNVMNVASSSSNAALLSSTGAATVTFGGILAISWSTSIGLSIMENYIPNNWPVTKACITGTKYIIAVPIRFAEWGFVATTNFTEVNLFKFKEAIPTRITENFALQIGPRIKDLKPLKDKAIDLIIAKLQVFRGGGSI